MKKFCVELTHCSHNNVFKVPRWLLYAAVTPCTLNTVLHQTTLLTDGYMVGLCLVIMVNAEWSSLCSIKSIAPKHVHLSGIYRSHVNTEGTI